MGENYERAAGWLKACGKEPNAGNLSLQIGCHIEEFTEFWGTLSWIANEDDQELLENIQESYRAGLAILADGLKKGRFMVMIHPSRRVHALDALCDMEVTGNGVAYLGGFNKPPADKAVLHANECKLVDGKPVILEGGKIGKPKGWVAPDLSGFV